MDGLNRIIQYFNDDNITKSRLANFLLVQQEIREKKTILKSMPYRYILEPTNSCNLECPLCPSSVKFKGKILKHMGLIEFKKTINYIESYALELYLQNWGESTLNSELINMIDYANKKNIFTYLSTNFSVHYTDAYLHSLMSSGLSVLHIDLDGTDAETYKRYRVGGNFDLLISNIKKIVKIKKELNYTYPIIKTHFMVMNHNEHQIEESKQLAKYLGVDEHTIGNIQVNPNTSYEWLPSDKKYVYSTYKENTNSPSICNWLYSSLVINSNGSISPCCIVFDEKATFGNLFQDTLAELRNNKYFTSARSVFTKDKEKVHTICSECKNMTHSTELSRVGNTFSIKLKNTKMKK